VFEEVSSGAGGGEESDLAMATQLLTDAEMRLGLGETLTWHSPDITARLLAQQSRTRIEDILRTAEAETRAALSRHRAALERIAEALTDTRELHAEDLADLLDQVTSDRTTESADCVDANERTTQAPSGT
jgi:ATP-dependent Zn protease